MDTGDLAPPWVAAVATIASYVILLAVIFVVLFVVPYLAFRFV